MLIIGIISFKFHKKYRRGAKSAISYINRKININVVNLISVSVEMSLSCLTWSWTPDGRLILIEVWSNTGRWHWVEVSITGIDNILYNFTTSQASSKVCLRNLPFLSGTARWSIDESLIVERTRLLVWHHSVWRGMLPLCQNSQASLEHGWHQGRRGDTKVQQRLKYHSWCLCFNSLTISLVFDILHARNGWFKRPGAFL